MGEEAVVQTLGLSHEYGDTLALEEVNLAVPRGAVVALVGPNGAGKTTLLKIVAALLEPTRGTARVGGLDIRDAPREVHSLIGFLPDFYGLYDELSVWDYLEYFGLAYRLTNATRHSVIKRVLEQVGLPDKNDSPIGSLSRGMRQRLAIARTLIHDPPVLLLDEPAAGLDPEGRHELQFLFRALAQAGKTLVVSSHILTELEDYCTHVAILQRGVLVASGLAEQIRESLSQGRQVRIRITGEPGKLEALLKEENQVRNLQRETEGWTFLFLGNGDELAELLKRLVASGIGITFFGEEKRTIQDVYLALTQPRQP